MRNVLPEAKIHPAISDKVANYHRDIVDEVQAAVAKNDVVVVGMKQNPFPRKACAALKGAGIDFKYLEYGSYMGEWRRRSALKMWTGWPTFPMVFVKGQFVGGCEEVKQLIEKGELSQLLS
jgi:glutaredoxin-related protein